MPNEAEKVERVIDTLFPQHPPLVVTLPDVSENASLLDTKELDDAGKRLKRKYWEALGLTKF